MVIQTAFQRLAAGFHGLGRLTLAAGMATAVLTSGGVLDVKAQELKILSAHLPPYSMNEGDQPGFVREVAQELAQRVGQSDAVSYSSWSRVYNEVQTQPHRLLAPVARTAQREDQLSWVVEVFPDRMVMLTYGEGAEPTTLDEAANDGIMGVQQDSLMHEMAEARGMTNLDVSGDLNSIARKFGAGRIKSWLSLESLAIFSMLEEGVDTDKVVVGEVINEFGIYVGGSPDLTDAEMQPWRDAFAEMQEDGSYDTIMAKYGF